MVSSVWFAGSVRICGRWFQVYAAASRRSRAPFTDREPSPARSSIDLKPPPTNSNGAGEPNRADQNLTTSARPNTPSEDQRLAELETARRFAQAVIKNQSIGKISEAALGLAATHIYSILVEYPRDAMIAKLAEDPSEVVKLLNAFTRLTDLGLKQQKETDQQAEAGSKGLTPEIRELLEGGLSLL